MLGESGRTVFQQFIKTIIHPLKYFHPIKITLRLLQIRGRRTNQIFNRSNKSDLFVRAARFETFSPNTLKVFYQFVEHYYAFKQGDI
jgi:hypothetical protein